VEKVKTHFWPVLGALVFGLGLGLYAMPNMFGYVSEADAGEQSEQAVTQPLLPMCVGNAQAESEKMAEVLAMQSYRRDDGVEEADWAVYPKDASTQLKDRIVDGCVDALEAL